MNPFYLEGPAAISFSGGRTSALMLRRILDACGGTLPPDVHVLFANTGKERPETLEFVRECGERWGVEIHWLEYERMWVPSRRLVGVYVPRAYVKEVNYDTASRDGHPFERLVEARAYLPNPVTRICTSELKIRTMHRWLRGRGFKTWTQVVGLRYDEPDRVTRILGGNETPDEHIICPLFTARVTKSEVMTFWGGAPFDLRLRPWEGNCDLCFLKGQAKRLRIMQDTPHLSAWWVAMEAKIGASFRAHTPSYARLATFARDQLRLPLLEEDPTDLGDCACTD